MMGSAILKWLYSLIVPGGVLVLAALAVFRPSVLPDSFLPFVTAYPFVVFGAGLVLGWYFNRSRIVFATLVLALADAALLQFGAEGRVFNAIALLLPLNLAAYAMLTERGLVTARGLVRFLPILGQLLLVVLISRMGQRGGAGLLDVRLAGVDSRAWTPIPQLALLAFGAAVILQAVRFSWHRHAIESGFFWALIAAFIALHVTGTGWNPTHYLASAGLILVVSLLETSYRMAYHDELTRLPSRRALNEALLKLNNHYTVAMVDIDYFKDVNDQYGHDVGDQVLCKVASKLNGVSGGGRAYRYGGEEFSVLFPGKSVDEALPHLETLRENVEASGFGLRGRDRPRRVPKNPRRNNRVRKEVSVTISIGVAERNRRNEDPGQVVKAADQALYRAKKAGRNQVSA